MGPFLSRHSPTETNSGTYDLVWLDATVSSSAENLGYQERLRQSINQLNPFDNEDACTQYLQSLTPNSRVIFICSGKLGRTIVPRIHNSRQIHSIYVFCRNRQDNEQWSQPYTKASSNIHC